MQEFIGLAYFAEIPAVIFDIQRGSPSTGMPTRTQQADILSCAYASHGDTKHVLLFPEDPRESFAFAAEALDLADRLQTPVFVHAGPRHRHERLAGRAARVGRRPALRPRQGHDRRDARGRGWSSAAISTSTATASPIAPIPGPIRRAAPFLPAAPARTATRATPRKGPDYVDNMQRLLRKFETAKRLVPQPIKRDGA